MLIDWFTVVAQIVNFLVLVGLMKHFLYGRLVQAIDAREQRISTRLAEAEKKNHDADDRVEAARVEADRVRQQREQTIAEARSEADREHKEMLQKARDSVRALETKWHEDLDREKAAFLDEIRSRATTEVLAIARRALADLAGADLEQCAIDSFLEKLKTIDITGFGRDLVLRTGTELPEPARQCIGEAIRNRFGAGVNLEFERAPQMSWGLELRTNGRRIGWNPDNYIGSLEENLRHALEHHPG
ncbi:MAG: hypothetical protein LAO79_08330 [Acidobacteriia bacterium]|nr:hypothetical protein [Terriglobia bacterium]